MNMKFEIIKVLIIMAIVFVAFFIVSYLLDKKQEKENEKNGVEKHIVHTKKIFYKNPWDRRKILNWYCKV